MKIGLVTIFDVPNYGSVLQAFATKKVLELLGNDVSTINYTRKRLRIYILHNSKKQ